MAKKDKKKRSVLAGTLQKHKNGFGFVDAGGEEDIFIPPDGMNGAMDGDVVEIDLLPPYMWDRRPEAIVTRVRERAVSEVIGTFYRRKNYGFVVPEGGRSADDIFIEKKHIGKASGGDKVVCEIIKYPDGREKPEGRIVEIMGPETDYNVAQVMNGFDKASKDHNLNVLAECNCDEWKPEIAYEFISSPMFHIT